MFFAPNEEILDQNLASNSINLKSVDYNYEYSACMFTCVDCHKHSHSISVPGIMQLGLCFTQPCIVLSLDKDDPKATVLNSPEKFLAEDTEFLERVRVQSLKLIYEYMQDKHIELNLCLESLSEEYSTFP